MAFTAFAAFIRRLGWSFSAHFECLQHLGGIGAGPLWRLQCSWFFIGHWGWTFVALSSVCSVYEGCRLVFLFYLFIYFLCEVACSVYGALGWDPCGVYSVSRFLLGIGVGRLWRFSAFEGCRLVCLLYLFIYCVAWRGVECSVYGALGWGTCGVHSVCSVYEAFGLVAFLWHLECL